MMLGKPMMAFFFFILAVGAGYGTYFLVTSSYVEYEYTFTNGELDVDKIIAKKKRTSLLSVEVRSFTDFGRYSDGLEESEDMTVVFATDNVASKEYYADFDHKEYGITRLVFVPDERMLDNIRSSCRPSSGTISGLMLPIKYRGPLSEELLKKGHWLCLSYHQNK